MTADSSRLTSLELKVLVAALLDHPSPAVRQLFSIIPSLRVKERKFTGVGFYTQFFSNPHLSNPEVDDATLKANPPEAIGFHPDLDGVVNFLIWIEGGQIGCLEAAASETWPHDDLLFVVSRNPTK